MIASKFTTIFFDAQYFELFIDLYRSVLVCFEASIAFMYINLHNNDS